MSLDPTKVPASCALLLPLAEEWGIGDDFERDAKVEAASSEELAALIRAVDQVPDADLYGWLAGPESHSDRPTEEYIAITCLTMAADMARAVLRRR